MENRNGQQQQRPTHTGASPQRSLNNSPQQPYRSQDRDQYLMPQQQYPQQQYPQQQYPQQQYPQQQAPTAMPAITIVNSNANTNTNINEMEQYSRKSKTVTLLLAIFLGWLGAHRFYVGKIGTGILWACSFGVGFVGWIADVVMIIIGSFRDKDGYRLR